MNDYKDLNKTQFRVNFDELKKVIEKSNKYDELLSILEEYNVDLSNIREILVAGNMAQDWRDKTNKYDEKETPQKPIKKTLINSYDYDEQGINKNEILQCPSCKFELYNEYECIDYTFDYCPYCGQRIDWRDK